MPQEQNKKLYILGGIVLFSIFTVILFIRWIVSDGQSQKFTDNFTQPSQQLSFEYQSGYELQRSLTGFTVQLPERVNQSDYQTIKDVFEKLGVANVTTGESVATKKIQFTRLKKVFSQNVNFGIISSAFSGYQNLYFLPRAVDYPIVYTSKNIQTPKIIQVSQLQTRDLVDSTCRSFYIPVGLLDLSLFQKNTELFPGFLDITRLIVSQSEIFKNYSLQTPAQDQNGLTAFLKKNISDSCSLICLIDKNLICGSFLMKSSLESTVNTQSFSIVDGLPGYLYGRQSTEPISKNLVDALYQAGIYFGLYPATNSILDEEYNGNYQPQAGLFIGGLTGSNQ